MGNPGDVCLRCGNWSGVVTFVVHNHVRTPLSHDREEVRLGTRGHDLCEHARRPLVGRLSLGFRPASAALSSHLGRAHPCIDRVQAGGDDQMVAFLVRCEANFVAGRLQG
jgi:hypothetical protein